MAFLGPEVNTVFLRKAIALKVSGFQGQLFYNTSTKTKLRERGTKKKNKKQKKRKKTQIEDRLAVLNLYPGNQFYFPAVQVQTFRIHTMLSNLNVGLKSIRAFFSADEFTYHFARCAQAVNWVCN